MSILPTKKGLEIPVDSRGSQRPNILKKCMKLDWGGGGGGGGVLRKRHFLGGGGMNISWNHTFKSQALSGWN